MFNIYVVYIDQHIMCNNIYGVPIHTLKKINIPVLIMIISGWYDYFCLLFYTFLYFQNVIISKETLEVIFSITYTDN